MRVFIYSFDAVFAGSPQYITDVTPHESTSQQVEWDADFLVANFAIDRFSTFVFGDEIFRKSAAKSSLIFDTIGTHISEKVLNFTPILNHLPIARQSCTSIGRGSSHISRRKKTKNEEDATSKPQKLQAALPADGWQAETGIFFTPRPCSGRCRSGNK